MRIHAKLAGCLCALGLMTLGPQPAHGQEEASSEPLGKDERTTPKGPRLFLLVDFPYQLWNEGGTKIHVVAFTPVFKPAAGAEVRLAGTLVGRTDRDGTLIFNFKSPRGWKGADLVVKHRQGRRLLVGRQRIEAYRRTSSYEKNRVYLYTDRGIYRPGERLRARLVAFRMRDSYEPLAGKQAVVTLDSPWGDVQRHKLTLDAFGVGHLELDLKDLEPVAHTLSVEVGGARHSRTVKLAHFKRPSVELRHSLPRWFTGRSKDLNGDIRINDLNSKSPRGGNLSVTVEAAGRELAKRDFPLDGRSRYPLAFSRADVIRFARGLTTGQTLQVTMRARLANGTTAENTHEVRLEARPFRAVIETDRDDYPPGGLVTALVKLSDPDDLPAAGVSVTLALPGGQRLAGRSNPQGTAAFTFKAPETSKAGLHLLAFAEEVEGPLARSALVIKKPRSMESRLGVSQVLSRRSVPIAVTLQPGFTPLERVLHVDVTDHSGAIVAGFTLPWRRAGNRWKASGQFKAPSWGTMLLTLFSLAARTKDLRDPAGRPKPVTSDEAGVILDGQQVTVHPDEALRLTISGVPDELRPGAPLDLGLRILGPDGKPTDALVGGALVDANVLALGDPLAEIDPIPYFYNPQLRVMASTGSKMLTWPVLARTWGCDNYDIALPPFDFVEGGPEDCESGFGAGGIGFGGWGHGGGGGRDPERFTIRERFDATSWWAPALRAPGGKLTARLTMPDSISRQVLLLVATDRRGGVGHLRRVITVRRPISLELDLPESLAAGEELEVVGLARNETGRPLALTLAAKTEGITLLSVPSSLRVPLGEPTPFRIRIRATAPGPASLELRAWQGNQGDALRRQFAIRPAGEPLRETLTATARPGAPARLVIQRRKGDVSLLASVKVDYPHLVPALQSVESALAHPSLGADSSAGVTSAAALVLRSQKSLPPEKDAALRSLLERGTRWLLAGQATDGSFAYWRHGLPDPLHSAFVLETLLDVREAGVSLPTEPLARVTGYLLGALAPDGLWNLSSLAFWEGSAPDIRTGLSASIFRALTRATRAGITPAGAPAPASPSGSAAPIPKGAGPSASPAPRAAGAQSTPRSPASAGGQASGKASAPCTLPFDPRLARLARRMEHYVSGKSRDPRTVAAALEGLHQLYTRCDRTVLPTTSRTAGGRTLTTAGFTVKPPLTDGEKTLLQKGATNLLALRDREHWEPTWFDAYGGQLEATAAAMRILFRLDRIRHAQIIREAAAFLMARRQSWGEWHNERGTASTIRALLEVAGTGPEERQGALIRILVNGKAIREITLVPTDPWANAAMLGEVQLTGHLGPPTSTLEVQYTGALHLPVRVALRRWPGPGQPAAQGSSPRGGDPAGAQANTPSGTAMGVQLPQATRLGEKLYVTVPLRPMPNTPGSASHTWGLVFQMPVHLAPDPEGLRALRRAHPWLGLTLRGDTWTLTLPHRPLAPRVQLPLVASRRGSARVSWRPLDGTPLTPGSLPITVE